MVQKKKTEPAFKEKDAKSSERRRGCSFQGHHQCSWQCLAVSLPYFMMFGDYIYQRLSRFLRHFFTLRPELEFEVSVLLQLFVGVSELTAVVLRRLSGSSLLCRFLGI